MFRSRRTSDPPAQEDEPEAFPNYPTTPGIEPAPQEHTATSTTTTTTVIGGNGQPPTTTITSAPAGPGAPGVTLTTSDPNAVPFTRTQVVVPAQPIRRRPIGIRRLPSASSTRQSVTDSDPPSRSGSGRRRSASAPQGPGEFSGDRGSKRLSRQPTSDLPMLKEEATQPQPVTQPPAGAEHLQVPGQVAATVQTTTGVGRRRSVSDAARSVMSRFSDREDALPSHEYEADVVDYLDVIDPEVSTLTTLTNVQNSLFVPDLGRWLNRRPTFTLSRAPSRIAEPGVGGGTQLETIQSQPEPNIPEMAEEEMEAEDEEARERGETPSMQRSWSWQRKPPDLERTHSITSVMSDSHYAVLPHGVNLEGWTEEDKEALDDHVRHMLHSKRSKFKQRMHAFKKYISHPLGFLVTLYAVLITLFGLAWVLFLIGWINVGDQKSYVVNVIDNVLVALFALVGDGLAPFRAVDTYHMAYIAHYHKLSWRLRRERGLTKLRDHNDLPEQREKDADPEAAKPEDTEFSVLSPQQQKKLIHHQTKFSKSHSFYKPHETATHYAFPLKLLITVVTLLDAHSILQIMLGTFTWAWSYHSRPTWITTVILCCSITVNITAGVFISIGDRKTRKKEVITRMARQEMTRLAIKKMKKEKRERQQNVQKAENHENFEVIKEEAGETGESSGASRKGSGEGDFVTPMTSRSKSPSRVLAEESK